MNIEEAKRFAEQWVNAWNRHDIDAVLAHYADDFAMTTPMLQRVLGVESGTLRGKQAVGDYWRAALKKTPDLKFRVREVTAGVGTVSVYYDSVMGKTAIETFFFDAQGKVREALATYN